MQMYRFRSINLVILLVVVVISTMMPAASAFAAKKGGGGKKRVTAAAKGFGAPPLTWEDVAKKIKTRAPPNAESVDCPCASGSVYRDCCAPYHAGIKYPETPMAVLRSRYTAFAWRDIRYVIDTTHPKCGDWQEDKVSWVKDLNKRGMFDNHDFVGLSPGLEELVGDDEGFITFTVKLRGHDGSDFEGQERVIRERSQFLKGEDGRWTYATGEVVLEQ